MPEHRIRLRGGWELEDPDAGAKASVMMALPVVWDASPSPRRLRLVRRFGRPRSNRVRLVLENVEGLRSASLNGLPLTFEGPSSGSISVDLPALDERNVLTFDVEIGGADGGPATPWGSIALLIAEESDGASRSGDGAR